MSEWKQKRFWTEVSVVAEDDGFAVALDGRRLKTPAKAALLVPTETLAQAIAAEWQAQDKEIDPGTMPFTRTANSALDKVAHQHAEVAELLAAYGDSDLLCYRADSPRTLVDRQAAQWDPPLAWAAATFGAELQAHTGVMHVPQSADALAKLRAPIVGMTPFQLAAFHDLVGLCGSLVLGYAAARGWKSAAEIWQISQLDELWQAEQWGDDDEALETAEIKRQAFEHAARFWAIC